MTRTHTYLIPGALLAFLLMSTIALADHGDMAPETHAVMDMPVATSSVVPYQVASDCTIAINLMIGSRSDEVACLQQMLMAAGQLRISAPTGYFGEMTKAALMQWQDAHGIAATGFFGPLSRTAFGHQHEAMTDGQPSTDMHAAEHAHEPVDASQWPAVPSVSIALHKDAMSGYNLEITPANFRFAPEHVNGAVVPNEGHTHVYIDGVKYARAYASWLHLPGTLFNATGTSEVVVTLNANDHSDLTISGSRVEARATVQSH